MSYWYSGLLGCLCLCVFVFLFVRVCVCWCFCFLLSCVFAINGQCDDCVLYLFACVCVCICVCLCVFFPFWRPFALAHKFVSPTLLYMYNLHTRFLLLFLKCRQVADDLALFCSRYMPRVSLIISNVCVFLPKWVICACSMLSSLHLRVCMHCALRCWLSFHLFLFFPLPPLPFFLQVLPAPRFGRTGTLRPPRIYPRRRNTKSPLPRPSRWTSIICTPSCPVLLNAYHSR